MSRPIREPSSRKGRLPALALFAAALFFPPPALADDDDEPPPKRIELRHDLRIDIPVTVGLLGATTAWVAVRNDLVPARCGWCDGDAPGEVNGLDEFFRDALRRRDPKPAETLSHVLSYGVAPVAGLALGGIAAAAEKRANELPLNILLVAEASAVFLAVNEILKPLARRERPDLHAMEEGDAKTEEREQKEGLYSFSAGHPGTAFAIAFAGGTIATMRGYRLAPLVWVSGVIIATATGYLRMAADRHYFTDVLAGSVLGASIGAAVPLLFHGPKKTRTFGLLENVTVGSQSVVGGRVVTVGGTF
jgi:membrane-associated phospholipid phosphatase